MPGLDRGPLLGTVVDGHDVYEIREGVHYPVVIYRGDSNCPVGHITKRELSHACEGGIPHFGMAVKDMARLAGFHIELRTVVGELIRQPDPEAIIRLDQRGARR